MSERCGITSVSGCALTLVLLDAARAVEARVEGALEHVGLSLATLGALRHLVLAGEPLTLTQLAERHCCGRANVTQLMARLESDGLVARVPDSKDRRTVLAIVTDEGRSAYDRASQVLAEQEADLEERLGGTTRADLVRGLLALREG